MSEPFVKRLIAERTISGRDILGVWDVAGVPPEKLATLRDQHATEYVYARDYDALAVQLAEARALLTKLEWGPQDASCLACPICQAEPPIHAAGCPLAICLERQG